MNLGLDQFNQHFEKLAKLPKPVRMAIVPVVLALVISGYVYSFYLPGKQEMEQIQAQQLKLQRKLNEVRSVASNLEKFQAEIEELENRFQVALRQLPNSKELPVLLTDISTLGKNAGLEVKGFRPRQEVRRDFYAEVPIEIEFSGRYHDIALFFDEVSRLPRIVNVGELDMQVASEDSLETVLNVTGQARTFRFIEDAARSAKPNGGKAAAGRKGQR